MPDIAAALNEIDRFEKNSTPTIVWGLNRTATLARLRTLVSHPEELNQRGLNACGPAIFFRTWLARDPVSAAKFACNLLRDGSASIGSMVVSAGSRLLAQDYAAVRATTETAHPNAMPDTADWMLLSGLRDSENLFLDYLGEPYTVGDKFAGLTLPLTVTSWLTATNLYRNVENATTVVPGPDPQRLLNFIPTSNVDGIVLVNSSFNANLYPTLASRPATPPVLSAIHVPDHYVLATAPCALDVPWVQIEFWTWGRTMGGWVGTSDFGSRYFGMIVATA